MKNIFLIMVFLSGQLVPAWAEDKSLNVVTTQAIFADLVQEVGGNKVKVTAIASPKYNIHFIQPKPSDVRKVANADLYVNAGLDLEAWSDPLLEAAGKPQLFRNGPRNLDLSRGINLLNVPQGSLSRSEGDIHLFGNPHFHMNPGNAEIMVKAISEKLTEIDPTNASYYKNNTKSFLNRLEEKLSEWNKLCEHCRGKEIISYHDDIAYLADFLGLKDDQFLEPKPGIPPTPKHLQFLENYVQTHKVKAIILPTYFPRDAADRLAKRIGAKVLIITQQPGEVSGTDGFFSFFDYNIKQISQGVS